MQLNEAALCHLLGLRRAVPQRLKTPSLVQSTNKIFNANIAVCVMLCVCAIFFLIPIREFHLWICGINGILLMVPENSFNGHTLGLF